MFHFIDFEKCAWPLNHFSIVSFYLLRLGTFYNYLVKGAADFKIAKAAFFTITNYSIFYWNILFQKTSRFEDFLFKNR